MSCGVVVLRSWCPGDQFDDDKCSSGARRPRPYPMLRWPQPISLQHIIILEDDGIEITSKNVMTLRGAPVTELVAIRPCHLPPVLECQHVEDGLSTRSFVSPGCGPASV